METSAKTIVAHLANENPKSGSPLVSGQPVQKVGCNLRWRKHGTNRGGKDQPLAPLTAEQTNSPRCSSSQKGSSAELRRPFGWKAQSPSFASDVRNTFRPQRTVCVVGCVTSKDLSNLKCYREQTTKTADLSVVHAVNRQPSNTSRKRFPKTKGHKPNKLAVVFKVATGMSPKQF